MKLKRWCAAAAIALSGWSATAAANEILVGAASSLTNAFTELAIKFQQIHPGVKVLSSFAGSDALSQQIVNGAPIDIFASADQKAMDRAADAKVIEPATRQDFVRNEIVLIAPANSTLSINALADIKAAGVGRIAFGNPATVPAGRYTKAALEQAGYWNEVKRREVLGQNVRQVLDYVARGEVDAGFVFATDAAIMADKVRVVERLLSPIPVLYPIALVKRAGANPEAAEFLHYIVSADGQAVLAKYGFAKP